MKSWSIAVAILVALVVFPAAGDSLPDEVEVPGAEGKALAVIVVCNDCEAPKEASAEACHGGAEKGWREGKACGSCLLDSNWGTLVRYGRDLHITGTLVNAEGEPVQKRFLKLFMPNGWSVRTRTSETGTFRMMLGATDERQSDDPLVVDVGTRTDSRQGKDPYYALFLLPVGYNPCEAGSKRPAS